MTGIADGAFSYIPNLKSVTIPDGVTYIGRYAFYNCSSLSFINIPENVTFIGVKAFYGTSLTSATFEKTSTWGYHDDMTHEFYGEIDPAKLQNDREAAKLLAEKSYGSNWKRS